MASGDFDGDGHADLAVGASDKFYIDRTGLISFDPRVGGEVFFIPGSGAGLDTREFQIIETNGRNYNELGRYGAALATGDFNGDGKADLAVGIPLYGSLVVNDVINSE